IQEPAGRSSGCKMRISKSTKDCVGVVDRAEVRPVEEVESFSGQLQPVPLAQSERFSQSCVHVEEIRTLTGIVAVSKRTVIGGVPVAVDVPSRQHVIWMSAVVTDDGRQLEAGKESTLRGTLHHAGHHHFMPLVKVGEAAFSRSKVGLIEWRKVAIEVSCVTDGLAVGVAGHQGHVAAEALLHLEDAAMING